MDINAALAEYASNLVDQGVDGATHLPEKLNISSPSDPGGVLVQPGVGGITFDVLGGNCYRLDAELVLVVPDNGVTRVRENLSKLLTRLIDAGVPMPRTTLLFGSVPLGRNQERLPCITVPVPLHVSD